MAAAGEARWFSGGEIAASVAAAAAAVAAVAAAGRSRQNRPSVPGMATKAPAGAQPDCKHNLGWLRPPSHAHRRPAAAPPPAAPSSSRARERPWATSGGIRRQTRLSETNEAGSGPAHRDGFASSAPQGAPSVWPAECALPTRALLPPLHRGAATTWDPAGLLGEVCPALKRTRPPPAGSPALQGGAACQREGAWPVQPCSRELLAPACRRGRCAGPRTLAATRQHHSLEFRPCGVTPMLASTAATAELSSQAVAWNSCTAAQHLRGARGRAARLSQPRSLA